MFTASIRSEYNVGQAAYRYHSASTARAEYHSFDPK